MAKSDSIFAIQGTVAGLTFVKSRAYGAHLRAKRGTHKKAEVNDALKQEIKRLVSANIPAKIIKDAIDPYRGTMLGGTFWQRLLSLFRKQLKESRAIDFANIAPFNVYEDLPFHRFLVIEPSVSLVKKNSILEVTIDYHDHPKFKVKAVDGYKLTVIGIFPDLKKKLAKTVAVESDVIKITGAISWLHVQLAVPAKATSYVVCIKIEGCAGGKVAGMRMAMAMQIFGSGRV
jgi:hypothetical protein